MYKVEFLEEAAQDWLDLDHSVRKRLFAAIERLRSHPDLYGKPLAQPLHRLRRIRSGDFRIVYRVNEGTKTVEVGVVCHRSQVYQIALRRRLV
ncbi:MAG: type II toxin-antitoxin system RelE/ParE family toxin [Nitrospirae bacterium]|nr:type II toxin-antitoxin system RelE/ParE family toxin [Nitrospirota bacterium]